MKLLVPKTTRGDWHLIGIVSYHRKDGRDMWRMDIGLCVGLIMAHVSKVLEQDGI